MQSVCYWYSSLYRKFRPKYNFPEVIFIWCFITDLFCIVKHFWHEPFLHLVYCIFIRMTCLAVLQMSTCCLTSLFTVYQTYSSVNNFQHFPSVDRPLRASERHWLRRGESVQCAERQREWGDGRRGEQPGWGPTQGRAAVLNLFLNQLALLCWLNESEFYCGVYWAAQQGLNWSASIGLIVIWPFLLREYHLCFITKYNLLFLGPICVVVIFLALSSEACLVNNCKLGIL